MSQRVGEYIEWASMSSSHLYSSTWSTHGHNDLTKDLLVFILRDDIIQLGLIMEEYRG